MAADDITIVDVKTGTSACGFYVRVGDVPPLVKQASYLGLIQAGVWSQTTYASFQEAWDAAIEYRNRENPTFKVRADCTLT